MNYRLENKSDLLFGYYDYDILTKLMVLEKFKLNFLKKRSYRVRGFSFVIKQQIKDLTSSSDLRSIESGKCGDFRKSSG